MLLSNAFHAACKDYSNFVHNLIHFWSTCRVPYIWSSRLDSKAPR